MNAQLLLELAAGCAGAIVVLVALVKLAQHAIEHSEGDAYMDLLQLDRERDSSPRNRGR